MHLKEIFEGLYVREVDYFVHKDGVISLPRDYAVLLFPGAVIRIDASYKVLGEETKSSGYNYTYTPRYSRGGKEISFDKLSRDFYLEGVKAGEKGRAVLVAPNFLTGTYNDIIAQRKGFDMRDDIMNTTYPAIVLDDKRVLTKRIGAGSTAGFYNSTFSLDLLHYTNTEYTEKERRKKVFNAVLYPLADVTMYSIRKDKRRLLIKDVDMTYSSVELATANLTGADKTANVFVDCLRLNNINLKHL